MTMSDLQTDAGMAGLLERMQADVYGAAAGRLTAGPDAGDDALAGLDLAAQIGAHFGRRLDAARNADRAQARAELARRLRGVAPIPLPPVPFIVSGGAPLIDVNAGRAAPTDLAPQDGYVWFLTHVAISGLQASTAGSPSASAQGSVTNPVLNGTITSISAAALSALAPAGSLFAVTWQAGLQGTVTAADANNMYLSSPLNTVKENGMFPGVVGNYPQNGVQFIVSGVGINVQATAAASGASAVYTAQITATPISGDDVVSLYKVSATGNNFLHRFTASQPDWNTASSSNFLLPDDYLVLAGTGLLSSRLVLSGRAIQVEYPLLADYLT